MGSINDWEIIKKSEEINDRTIKTEVENLIDQALYDYGHRGYTGTIAEADGVVLKLNKTFEVNTPHDWGAKYDWVEEIAEKWGPAVVCRATEDGEDIGYVVCGVYSY